MIEFFESNPEMYSALSFAAVIFTLAVMFVGGRKAEEKFRDLKQQNIRFRQRGASGRSHKSLKTKLASASMALDVIVTDRELWIKGILPMFTFIMSKFDLVHKVPLERVGSARVEGKSVFLTIRDELGSESVLELELRKPYEFFLEIGGTP